VGLDMGIYRVVKKGTTEEVFNKLEGGKDSEEIITWRKFWELQGAIEKVIGEVIENCTEYKLTRDNLYDIISWLKNNVYNENLDEYYKVSFSSDMEILNKLAEETDFDNYVIIYYGWW
jgi:hypothetical protein